MMDRYDPNQAPDPDEWNALDESEQLQLVKQYHKRERVKLPNTEVHAVFHIIVENQIAMDVDLNVQKTLDRLIADGLDRHDALHAVGTVIAGHMQSMMSDEPSEFRQDVYASELDMLTVETWRAMGEPEG
jgi:hypothetical protein